MHVESQVLQVAKSALLRPMPAHSRETTTVEVLVIAGFDPSGGAGIDVDRKAIQDLGGEAECVATAFTDQDSNAVREIGARQANLWADEVRDLWKASGGFDVVKFGLLPGAEHIRAAAKLVGEWKAERPNVRVVVDPVIEASSGAVFLDAEGRRALKRELLPRGVILTPNLPELAKLSGTYLEELIEDLDQRCEAARELSDLGASAVIVKGGHGDEDPICDLILEPGKRAAWRTHPRVLTATGKGATIRGTGCRFASALALGLGSGLDLAMAVDQAGRYVSARIAESAGETASSWDRSPLA